MFRRHALFLALCVSLFAGQARAAELDKILPDDTEYVVCVNLKQIVGSAIGKKFVVPLVEAQLDTEEAKAIVKLTGLKPLEDFASVTLGGSGASTDKKWLGLIRGTFNLDKINEAVDAAAKKHADKVKIEEIGNVRLCTVTIPKTKDTEEQKVHAAFLSKEVLIFAPLEETVKAAIKKKDRDETKVNKDLKGLLGKIDSTQGVWLASVVGEGGKAELGKLMDKDQVAKIKSATGGILFGDKVKARFSVQTTDAKTAKDFKQKLEGFRGLALMMLNGMELPIKDLGPILTEVFNAFKFAADQTDIVVELTLTEKMFEKNDDK